MRLTLITGGACPLAAAICRVQAADGLHAMVHAHAGCITGQCVSIDGGNP